MGNCSRKGLRLLHGKLEKARIQVGRATDRFLSCAPEGRDVNSLGPAFFTPELRKSAIAIAGRGEDSPAGFRFLRSEIFAPARSYKHPAPP